MDDNIFDDVDAILDEEISAEEDKNFNENFKFSHSRHLTSHISITYFKNHPKV